MECPRCKRTVDPKLRRCNWCGVNVPPGQHMLEESGIVVPNRDTDSASNFPIPRLPTLGDRLITVLLYTAILTDACELDDDREYHHQCVIDCENIRITTASKVSGI